MHCQVPPFDKFNSRMVPSKLQTHWAGEERGFYFDSLCKGALINLRPQEFIVSVSQNLSKKSV